MCAAGNQNEKIPLAYDKGDFLSEIKNMLSYAGSVAEIAGLVGQGCVYQDRCAWIPRGLIMQPQLERALRLVLMDRARLFPFLRGLWDWIRIFGLNWVVSAVFAGLILAFHS